MIELHHIVETTDGKVTSDYWVIEKYSTGMMHDERTFINSLRISAGEHSQLRALLLPKEKPLSEEKGE